MMSSYSPSATMALTIFLLILSAHPSSEVTCLFRHVTFLQHIPEGTEGGKCRKCTNLFIHASICLYTGWKVMLYKFVVNNSPSSLDSSILQKYGLETAISNQTSHTASCFLKHISGDPALSGTEPGSAWNKLGRRAGPGPQHWLRDGQGCTSVSLFPHPYLQIRKATVSEPWISAE